MNACSQAAPETLPTFLQRDAIPTPQFQLFEVVILNWQSEDGKVTKDEVQILGLTWCPSHALISGWWYYIRYLRQPTDGDHLKPGHEEECRECELSTLNSYDLLVITGNLHPSR